MSAKEHEADGMVLRLGEWELLWLAREGTGLSPEDSVIVLERLGRLRAARKADPQYRDEADALRRKLEGAERARASDLRRFEREMRRVRRQRDDFRAAARDETARRMTAQRRAGEL